MRHWIWRVNAERRRGERKPSAIEAEALRWVEVAAPTKEPEPAAASPSAPTEKLELVLSSGLTVRVPARFEPDALRRLLAVVG